MGRDVSWPCQKLSINGLPFLWRKKKKKKPSLYPPECSVSFLWLEARPLIPRKFWSGLWTIDTDVWPEINVIRLEPIWYVRVGVEKKFNHIFYGRDRWSRPILPRPLSVNYVFVHGNFMWATILHYERQFDNNFESRIREWIDPKDTSNRDPGRRSLFSGGTRGWKLNLSSTHRNPPQPYISVHHNKLSHNWHQLDVLHSF